MRLCGGCVVRSMYRGLFALVVLAAWAGPIVLGGRTSLRRGDKSGGAVLAPVEKGLYYSGDAEPSVQDPHVPGRRFNELKQYRQNPYWQYFKKIWGNAPMIDTNFRLWLSGFFKSYTQPKQSQPYQETPAVPAYFHYYGKTYDPLKDPPYESEFNLFDPTGPSGAAAPAAPIGKLDGNVRSDCTSATRFANSAGYKRPCGVNEKEALSMTDEKDKKSLHKYLGRSAYEEGVKMNAGSPRGTVYFTWGKLPKDIGGEGKERWIGLDKTWGQGWSDSNAAETWRPANMPQPPKLPDAPKKPTFGFPLKVHDSAHKKDDASEESHTTVAPEESPTTSAPEESPTTSAPEESSTTATTAMPKAGKHLEEATAEKNIDAAVAEAKVEEAAASKASEGLHGLHDTKPIPEEDLAAKTAESHAKKEESMDSLKAEESKMPLEEASVKIHDALETAKAAVEETPVKEITAEAHDLLDTVKHTVEETPLEEVSTEAHDSVETAHDVVDTVMV